jgi:hypothetical protein
VRFFYAHRADDSPQKTREACGKLKQLLINKTGKEYVKVIPGRADHEKNFRGDWESWQTSIVMRKDATTASHVYDAFIVCGQYCGRATANILKQALTENRSVFWWDGECPGKLHSVTAVLCSDPEDWSGGWIIQVNHPKKPKQLKLPFRESAK